MAGGQPYGRLLAALRDRVDHVVDRWAQGFSRSPWRFGRVGEEEVSRLLVPVVESLSVALSEADPGGAAALAPGSRPLRELEKSAGFLGAALASGDAAGFDVAAAVLALPEAVADLCEPDEVEALGRLSVWLAVVALDSFGTAKNQRERERSLERLARGTPVVLLAPELPAALLVADPDTQVLDAVFGRLVLMIVRVGARAVVLDVSGLDDPAAAPLLAELGQFFGHRKVAGAVAVMAVGLDAGAQDVWQTLAGRTGVDLACHVRFDDAVAAALAAGGYELSRRRST